MVIFSTAYVFAVESAAAGNALQNGLRPLLLSMIGVAALVCTFFIVIGGFRYMTSSGHPQALSDAKQTMTRALLGLILVIAAGVLVGTMTSSLPKADIAPAQSFPTFEQAAETESSGSIVDVLVQSIIGLFKAIISSAATPFLSALDYFTTTTPLMSQNKTVFVLWASIVGIANALLILVVALIGFHVMGAHHLGFDELDLKQLLPQLVIGFIVMNGLLFFIDGLISLSNLMITALTSAFSDVTVFQSLLILTADANVLSLVSLILIVGFLALSVLLLVFYVVRLVTLYVGAILSPLIILLYLLPGFRDFALSAARLYLTTIFILFVHVVILLLAASLLLAARFPGGDDLDPFMAIILGIATVVVLLRSQSVVQQLATVSSGSRALRHLSRQFSSGISYTRSRRMDSKPPSMPQPSLYTTHGAMLRESPHREKMS